MFDVWRAEGTYPPKGYGWMDEKQQRELVARYLRMPRPPQWALEEARRFNLDAQTLDAQKADEPHRANDVNKITVLTSPESAEFNELRRAAQEVRRREFAVNNVNDGDPHAEKTRREALQRAKRHFQSVVKKHGGSHEIILNLQEHVTWISNILDNIRKMLDEMGVPRGTFADEHVVNLIAMYNARGEIIQRFIGDKFANLKGIDANQISDVLGLTRKELSRDSE